MERDESRGESGFEVKTPLGTARYSGKRMAELVSVLALVALTVIGMGLWWHSEDSRANSSAINQAFREMVLVQRQMLQAQREQNCLIAMKPEERNVSFCQRVTR